jgi:hypothetical protein
VGDTRVAGDVAQLAPLLRLNEVKLLGTPAVHGMGVLEGILKRHSHATIHN